MAGIAQTSTKKHRQFVSEPMGQKPSTDLSGIGTKYVDNLKEAGFGKAFNVLGQFLVLDKEEEPFVDWLMETSGANTKCATDCYNCLIDWSNVFVI